MPTSATLLFFIVAALLGSTIDGANLRSAGASLGEASVTVDDESKLPAGVGGLIKRIRHRLMKRKIRGRRTEEKKRGKSSKRGNKSSKAEKELTGTNKSTKLSKSGKSGKVEKFAKSTEPHQHALQTPSPTATCVEERLYCASLDDPYPNGTVVPKTYTTKCCDGLECKPKPPRTPPGCPLQNKSYIAYCVNAEPTMSPTQYDRSDWISPLHLAAAWISFGNGAYADDCNNALAIALGEGVAKPWSNPLGYICNGTDCAIGLDYVAIGKCLDGSTTTESCLVPETCTARTVDVFAKDVSVFNLNQVAADSNITLGPWQTTTSKLDNATVEERIAEAIGYVHNCCMDGGIVPASVQKKLPPEDDVSEMWCNTTHPRGCPQETDGKCKNPVLPDNPEFPVTTIFGTSDLIWCGCKTNIADPGHHATIGYSGRCNFEAKVGEKFYSRYIPLAEQICNMANNPNDDYLFH